MKKQRRSYSGSFVLMPTDEGDVYLANPDRGKNLSQEDLRCMREVTRDLAAKVGYQRSVKEIRISIVERDKVRFSFRRYARRLARLFKS